MEIVLTSSRRAAGTPLRCAVVALLGILALAGASWAEEDEEAGFGVLDERLLGVWEQVDVEEGTQKELLEITPTFLSVAQGGKLNHRERVVGMQGGKLVVNRLGNRIALELQLEGDKLGVRFTDPKTPFQPQPATHRKRYRRLAERPELFDIAPLPLGDVQPLAPERLATLQAELARRFALDQEVRKVFEKSGQRKPTDADTQRMGEVDRDNTAWLLETIAEVGWIDTPRFGPDAAKSAFLIVQHSGDLQLMKTALPEIEKDATAEGGDGGSYALLFDRFRMWMALEQRYGSQLGYGPDGLFLYPIEDLPRVDARRAKLGMEPLEQYLERFQERNGDRPVERRAGL